MDELKKLLQKLGLENNEPAIYLTALQTGTAPASIIGKRAGLNRSSARFTCDSLVNKGLMHSVQKGNTKIYTAASPDKIQLLLDLERKALSQKQYDLERQMGELEALHNPHSVLPKVRFYEGKRAVLAFYEDLEGYLVNSSELLIISRITTTKLTTSSHQKLQSKLQALRKKQKIKTRELFLASDDTAFTLANVETDTFQTELRLLNNSRIKESYDHKIYLTSNKVHFFGLEKGHFSPYIIYSQSSFFFFKDLFELLWVQAKPLSKP
jgi:sugar-specific transcriptional regulator TrmB